MQVWNVLHAALWKYRMQKWCKKSPSAHHHTTLSGCIFTTKAYINSRKKNLLNSNMSSTCPHNMVNFAKPTNGWDRFGSLGHPNKFQRISHLAFVSAATSLTGGQPNFAQCSAVSWAGTLCIHFQGLLPPHGILPGAKFTLRPSLKFSYVGSVTTRHSSSGHQPNFAAFSKGRHLYSAIDA